MRKTLVRLQKEGNVEDAAYILMQRIFPSVYPTIFVRDGICHKDHAISELGIFGAYLRYATPLSTTSLRLSDANLLYSIFFFSCSALFSQPWCDFENSVRKILLNEIFSRGVS